MGYRMRRCAAPLIAWLVAAVVIGLMAVPSSAHAADSAASPRLNVPSATLITTDGSVLYAKNPDAPRRVASTIKMLNALVVRDSVGLDTVITVSPKAAVIDDGGVGLKNGQKLTVRQLLSIMLVHSANDAAEALAIGIAGSEAKYVAMMNAKAKQLGLEHTHAADANGLGKRETSTAADLAVIARHLMADPVLRGIVHETRVRVPRPKGKSEIYGTTDQLLGSYRGIEGIKTGFTEPAGYCFVGAARRNGVELIGVVLGASGGGARFSQMRRLLDWGFAHTSQARLVSADQTLGVVAVANGYEPMVTVHAEKPLAMTVLDRAVGMTTQVSLPPCVNAPVAVGQRLGAVQISRDGVLIASVPLVADQTVAAPAAMPASRPLVGSAAPAQLGLWYRIASVMSGIGRMLWI